MYEERKTLNQDETKTTEEDITDVVRKAVAKMQIEQIMSAFGDNADAMLGWLVHRAGNQEPINGHRLDNFRMIVDNDYLTLMYPEAGYLIILDEEKLTVENLRKGIRAVIEHDQETLWNISRKVADEMCEE